MSLLNHSACVSGILKCMYDFFVHMLFTDLSCHTLCVCVCVWGGGCGVCVHACDMAINCFLGETQDRYEPNPSDTLLTH